MLGRLRKENAKEGYYKQNKKYFESRHITAGCIADVSGERSSETADESVKRHRIPHNLWEFASAKVIGEKISHSYGGYALTYPKDDGVCEHHGHRMSEHKCGETDYSYDHRNNSQGVHFKPEPQKAYA